MVTLVAERLLCRMGLPRSSASKTDAGCGGVLMVSGCSRSCEKRKGLGWRWGADGIYHRPSSKGGSAAWSFYFYLVVPIKKRALEQGATSGTDRTANRTEVLGGGGERGLTL